MKYTIGLDIGTASVGWAVINNGDKRIEDLGVRLFESAENAKDGKSLATPRREARSMRRRLARRGYRLERIKTIFEKFGVLTRPQMLSVHSRPQTGENNPYKYRAEGLDRLLSPEELFIAVYHIAKRRGYKSNRKKVIEGEGETAKENEKVKWAIAQNAKALADFRTVGEMFYKTYYEKAPFQGQGSRNKSGSYEHAVSREVLLSELKLLLNAQQTRGNEHIPNEFFDAIVNAIAHQRHYAQGDQIKKMVGNCTLEPADMRAAKASCSFEYFNVLQRLNNILIRNSAESTERALSPEERKKILDRLTKHKTEVKYSQLRKDLGLSQDERFNMVQYSLGKKDAEGKSPEELVQCAEEKTKFPSLKSYHIFKKTLGEELWVTLEGHVEILDSLATALTLYKTDKDIRKQLAEIHFQDGASLSGEIIEKVLEIPSFNGFAHISLVVIRKMIPFLEQGMKYDDACRSAGYNPSGSKGGRAKKLKPLDPEDHALTNPVVRRAIGQTIKVVNAIIDKHGAPYEVHLEFGRELAKDHKERQQIHKKQRDNEQANEKALMHIKELFRIESPKGHDLVKYKLWSEQGNKCAYSGKAISEHQLFDDGSVEVDHIIPFSRSFDDSYNNKVLVLKKENQEKGNRLPYEFFGGDGPTWHHFESVVSSLHGISLRKRENLLKKKFVLDSLTSRALNDTRFASRYMKNYIEDTLEFAEGPKKQRVLTINGMATAYLRKRWGLTKVREESARHHAQDAVVIAVTTPELIHQIARHAKAGEVVDYLHAHKDLGAIDPETHLPYDDDLRREANEHYITHHEHKTHEKFPKPWEGFRTELEARMSDDPIAQLKLSEGKIHGYNVATKYEDFVRPIFVSRMPRRKVTGAGHKETLQSPKMLGQGMSVTREKLSNITFEKLEKMAGKDTDKLLYGIIKARLEKHGNDPVKAFAEPLRKEKDGLSGPIVRSIKLVDVQKAGLLVNDGRALVDQATMVRIDVFSKPNKKGRVEFHVIPVYAHQFARKQLPMSFRDLVIDDAYKFVASVYHNDLVGVQEKDSVVYFYFLSYNIANGSMAVMNHDGSKHIASKGIKTLDNIAKYSVDLLGNYHLVRGERRQGMNP